MHARLRRLALLSLLAIAGAASAASPNYVRVSGSPSSINCLTQSFTFGPGATMSWSFASGSTFTVDSTAYINGASVGTKSSAFPQQSGSTDLQVINGSVQYGTAQSYPYTLSVDIVPQDPQTDGVRISFSCPGSSGTSFTTSVIPGRDAKLQASPASLPFGVVPVGSTSSPMTTTITNSGTADATGVSVSLNNTNDFAITANTCGDTIAQGASCAVTATFKPASAGPRGGTLSVARAGADPLSISMNGTGGAQLSMPGQLSFGSQAVGTTSAPQVVTVTNTGATAVTVSSVTSSSPAEFGVTSNCTTVQAGASCALTLTFTPAASGGRTGTITVTSDGVGSPQSITVLGSGTGSAPSGQLSMPSSLSLGTQTVGVPGAPVAVTVTNTGGAAVSVSAVSSSVPSEFSVSGNTCATVAPGAQCGFSVTFTPAAAGARTASITVTSNGAGSPQVIAASGTGTMTPTPGQLSLSTSATFPAQTVGTTSPPTVFTVANVGGSPVTISSVVSSAPSEFTASSGCVTTLNAGAQCVFSVTFTPAAAGTRTATVTVTSNGVGSPQVLSLTGTGSAVAAPGQLEMPSVVDVASVQVGSTGTENVVTLTNVGGTPVTDSTIASSNATEFTITHNLCSVVNPQGSCTFSFTFTPIAAGARTASVSVTSNGVGSPQSIALAGTGTMTPPPPITTIDIVEYHHAEWDHYFMTGIADEIAKLDAGVFKGWTRTGYSFKAYPLNTANSNAVCRFFSTSFGERSSHFYTPFVTECNVVQQNKDWQLEGEVFNIPVPANDGTCAAGTVPVYRLYNNGQGAAPNHRYTTQLSVRAQMLGAGWIPEGYGDIGVIMCSPT